MSIVVDQVSKRFGDFVALDAVSLEVRDGSLTALLGPSGGGKSTLIRMLATVLRPTSGDASVFGASVTRDPASVKRRIGYMSQDFSLYPDLTVAENLDFFAELRGVPRADKAARAERLLAFAGLPQVMLTVRGRKSGIPRSTPLLCTPYDGSFLVAGSNWGAPKLPVWVLNLRANPDAELFRIGR